MSDMEIPFSSMVLFICFNSETGPHGLLEQGFIRKLLQGLKKAIARSSDIASRIKCSEDTLLL